LFKVESFHPDARKNFTSVVQLCLTLTDILPTKCVYDVKDSIQILWPPMHLQKQEYKYKSSRYGDLRSLTATSTHPYWCPHTFFLSQSTPMSGEWNFSISSSSQNKWVQEFTSHPRAMKCYLDLFEGLGITIWWLSFGKAFQNSLGKCILGPYEPVVKLENTTSFIIYVSHNNMFYTWTTNKCSLLNSNKIPPS
jgi:hypothetical protein